MPRARNSRRNRETPGQRWRRSIGHNIAEDEENNMEHDSINDSFNRNIFEDMEFDTSTSVDATDTHNRSTTVDATDTHDISTTVTATDTHNTSATVDATDTHDISTTVTATDTHNTLVTATDTHNTLTTVTATDTHNTLTTVAATTDANELFQRNLLRSISTVDVLRGYASTSTQGTRRSNPRRGPLASRLSVTLYHLPEAAEIPRLHKGRKRSVDAELQRQMEMGYGYSKSCWNSTTNKPKKTSLSLELNVRQFNEFVWSECPKLNGAEFYLYLQSRQKKLVLVSSHTPRDIKLLASQGVLIVYGSLNGHHPECEASVETTLPPMSPSAQSVITDVESPIDARRSPVATPPLIPSPVLNNNNNTTPTSVVATSSSRHSNDDLLFSQTFPPTSSSGHEKVLIVNRLRVLSTMVQHFSNETILTEQLKFRIQNERGVIEQGEDAGGVYREVLSIFWKDFYNAYCLGESEKVPAIRHDVNDQWNSVARVLIKGYHDVGYFPIMLNKAFLYGVCCEEEVEQSVLIASYLNYVPTNDSNILRSCMENVGEEFEDEEELLETLSDLGSKRLASNRSELKELLCELAHKDLIQCPSYIRRIWQSVFKNSKDKFGMSIFSSSEELVNIIGHGVPTQKRVSRLLTLSEDVNAGNREKETFQWLVKFVKGTNDTLLKSFLRFCTGSDMICVQKIKVTFNRLIGLNQRFIAHTCGCLLEVPVTYESYLSFKAHFTTQLESGYWCMDIM